MFHIHRVCKQLWVEHLEKFDAFSLWRICATQIKTYTSWGPGNRVSNKREANGVFYSNKCQLKVDSCLIHIDNNQYKLNRRTPGFSKEVPKNGECHWVKGPQKESGWAAMNLKMKEEFCLTHKGRSTLSRKDERSPVIKNSWLLQKIGYSDN